MKKIILTYEKGDHLLYWIYPCIVKKWGCGARDQNALQKAKNLSEVEIKKHLGTDYQYKYPYLFEFKNNKLKYIKSLPFDESYFENKALKSKINKEIFFNLLKEVDKTQILTSYIGSASKMLFHTSIIGIFEQHDISYKELKSIII